MSEQYGDLRVDRLTYTEAGSNKTVTVSGLVAQVQSGGTTSGSIRIEGDLTVTGTISGLVVTGDTGNFTTVNAETGVFQFLSGAVVTGNTAGFTTVTGATITGGTLNVTTGTFADGITSNGQIAGTTVTGSDALFTNGTFQALTGVATTGTSANYTFITGQNISGATGVFGTIEATNINFPATGISVATGVFTFLSGTTITGDTAGFGTITGTTITGTTLNVNNGNFTGDVTVEGTISGTTVTGTSAEFTTGTFDTIAGPIGSTTQTGVVRVATSAEAQSAVSPSGTYTDTISGDANSAFLINPSGLSSAFRSYDPPVGNGAGTTAFARVVVTTGIFPDQGIESVTWSGLDLSQNVTIVTADQATSATRPSGTYQAVVSGDANSQFVYNPTRLREAFESYDPRANAVGEQLYARVVSGEDIGGGQIQSSNLRWIQVPTGTPTIADSAQAAAAAGANGTYSETTTASNLANIINPFHLRDSFKAYDPAIVSGERRIYARVVSGVTATSGNYEWLNVTAAVDGSFLPLAGGTVTGLTSFTAGLGINGSVTQTGSFTQIGSHTTTGAQGFYDSVRASTADNVSYRINNSAGRGIFQSPNAGVGISKGGTQIAEFTVTGSDAFATISGDLRVGGNNQNVSDTNTSQFWAFEEGNFIAASPQQSTVWKDATNSNIFALQSNVGAQRSDVFAFGVSGQLSVSGQTGTSGQLLASRGPSAGVEWVDIEVTPGGDLSIHDLNVSGFATFASGISVTGTITGTAVTGVNVLATTGTFQTVTGVNVLATTGTFQTVTGVSGEFLDIRALDDTAGTLAAYFIHGHDVVVGDPNIYGPSLDNPSLQVLGTGIFASGVQITGILSLSSGLSVPTQGQGASGTFLMSQGAGQPVTWNQIKTTVEGDLIVHDLSVTGNFNAVSGGTFSGTVTGERFIATGLTGLSISGAASGLFNSGIFITDNTLSSATAIYVTAQTTNSPNIVIGMPGVLRGATTRNSIAIGHEAQENASSDSDRNIAIGNFALEDMTDGHQNIAIGHGAAQNIRPGNNQGANTAIGDNALFGNGASNNSSRANVAIGRAALFDALQARNNVAIGTQAGFNLATVTGNVLIGESVNLNGTTGDDNVFIGNLAALNNTASGNIAIGSEAAQSLTDGNNNTIIGSIAGAAGMSDTILLGAGTTQKVSISGDNFTLTSDGGDDATFLTSSLTADRTYTLPNKNGTFAMLADIPGGDSKLDVNNLSILNDTDVEVARISGDAGGSAMFASGQFTIDNNGNTDIAGNFNVSGNSTVTGVLSINNAAGDTVAVISGNQDGAASFASGAATINTAGRVTVNRTADALPCFETQSAGSTTSRVWSEGAIALGGAIGNSLATSTGEIELNGADGSAHFASGALTVNADGNLMTSGTLNVSGIVTFASGLNCNGSIGNAGDVLESQGLGLPARWQPKAALNVTGNISPHDLTVTGSASFSSGISVVGTVTGNVIQLNNAAGDATVFISGTDNGSASFVSGLVTIASGSSAATRGQLIINGDPNDGNNVGAKILGRGVVQVTRAANEAASQAFVSFVSGNLTPGTAINADGSASFASGNAKIEAGGSISAGLPDTSSTSASGVNLSHLGQVVVQRKAGDDTAIFRGFRGDTEMCTISGNGAASFASGQVTIYESGFTRIDALGDPALQLSRTGPQNNEVLRIFNRPDEVNLGAEVANIAGDGSASFASGKVSISTAGVITTRGINANGDTPQLILQSGVGGDTTINAKFNQFGTLYIGGDLAANVPAAPEITLNADGSAKFASGVVTIDSNGVVSTTGSITTSGGVFRSVGNGGFASFSDSTANLFVLAKANGANPTVQIAGNGSASFASGNLTISDNGAFFTNSTARFNQASTLGASQILGDSRGTYIQGNTDIYFCPHKDDNDSDDPVVAFYSGQVGIGGNLKASPNPAPLVSFNAVNGTASFLSGQVTVNDNGNVVAPQFVSDTRFLSQRTAGEVFNANSNAVILNANGSASFASGDVGISTDGIITTDNAVNAAAFNANQATANAQVITTAHNGNNTSFIQANGSAQFASGQITLTSSGTITASGYNLSVLQTLP